MHVLAIIPARGGSKGVPGKNLRSVGGIPLVGRAISAAAASALVSEIIVSTDDAGIAAVAESRGARVVRRPTELSGDTASSESALLHTLAELDAAPDVVVFIQATSPFIDPAVLDAAIARVVAGEADVVFSAVETYEFLWERTADGARGINHTASVRPRRQDREPHFRETGAFYVMRAAGFIAAGHRFFGRVEIAPVDELHSLEIDSLAELQLADAIAGLDTVPHASPETPHHTQGDHL